MEIQERPDYYDADGLLTCGKCHERKQEAVHVPFDPEKVITVDRACACLRRAYRARDDVKRAREIFESLKKEGLTDDSYIIRLEDDDRANEELSNIVMRYVENWEEMQKENVGLLFYGDVGAGKSFFARGIATRLMESGIPSLVTTMQALLNAVTREKGKDIPLVHKRLLELPLVVLDDLGTERGTDYVFEKRYELIDARYRSGKPTIITTNLTLGEMERPSDYRDKRIYDRIKEMCVPVLVPGTSRRGRIGRAKKEILGKLTG